MAKEDLVFQEKSRANYERMLKKIENVRESSRKIEDTDYTDHLEDL